SPAVDVLGQSPLFGGWLISNWSGLTICARRKRAQRPIPNLPQSCELGSHEISPEYTGRMLGDRSDELPGKQLVGHLPSRVLRDVVWRLRRRRKSQRHYLTGCRIRASTQLDSGDDWNRRSSVSSRNPGHLLKTPGKDRNQAADDRT